MDLKPIETFLVSAPTEAELRRQCTHLPRGATLALALPRHGVSFSELAHRAVVMLHSQRRLEPASFERLRELVPNRAPGDRGVGRGRVVVAAPVVAPTGSSWAAPPPSRPGVVRRLGAGGGVVWTARRCVIWRSVEA